MKLLFGILLFCTQSAWAHHSFDAEFDADAPVDLKGVVTKVEMINPHVWIHMNVPQPNGKPPQAWALEGGSPNVLFRNGLTKDSLKPGTEIVAKGYRAKDKSCSPACIANGRVITFKDGRKIFVGTSGTGAPRDGSDPSESAKPNPAAGQGNTEPKSK